MLYIVGSPIGNLDDISYRQAKILLESHYILSEDTRSFETLICACERLTSKTRNSHQVVVSYYKDKEFEKLPYVIDLLRKGETVALVSEAGMPLISDPGGLLVDYCLNNNIPHTVIPGPSSITAALAIAGIKSQNWSFVGFLPKKDGDVRKVVTKIIETNAIWKHYSAIAFESPLRFQHTMQLLDELIPQAKIIVCRELTKKFEEILIGTPKELMNSSIKGEIVLIIQL